MTLDRLAALAREDRLEVLGVCDAIPEDGLGSGAIALLGPAEPGFWPHVKKSSEWTDGAPDPLDRWSHRAISRIATEIGGEALFPFGDPVRPFVSWALRTGRSYVSPVGLLVHDTAGLLVSFRGAIFLPGITAPETAGSRPCDECPKPCLTTCPVNALTEKGYDLTACHAFLDTPSGQDCMSNGCRVRRSCPLSQSYGRLPEQSAYHMRHFHPCR